MKRFVAALAMVFLSASGFAASKFYASAEFQRQAPGAFALQPESIEALRGLRTLQDAQALVSALRAHPEIATAIRGFESLPPAAKIDLLHRVFDIEVASMGITAPELVIADDATNGPAYFDFDPEHPSAGRVLLNPKAFAEEKNPFAGLLLLVHETRHSAQFQWAFSNSGKGQVFVEAFRVQKTLKGYSFLDFMTLINEYEAFQFGNYVVGALTDWRVDTLEMGSFASQFDSRGQLKIDLVALASSSGDTTLLEKFNELEKEQEALLKRP